MSYLRSPAASLGGALVSVGRRWVFAESRAFKVYQVR